MAGDAAAGLAVHCLLEQFGDAGEEIGQLGKTFLQFSAKLDQMSWHDATDETMSRPLTPLHVLPGLEIRDLLAGAEHELLLGTQLSGDLRNAFDKAPQLTR